MQKDKPALFWEVEHSAIFRSSACCPSHGSTSAHLNLQISVKVWKWKCVSVEVKVWKHVVRAMVLPLLIWTCRYYIYIYMYLMHICLYIYTYVYLYLYLYLMHICCPSHCSTSAHVNLQMGAILIEDSDLFLFLAASWIWSPYIDFVANSEATNRFEHSCKKCFCLNFPNWAKFS